MIPSPRARLAAAVVALVATFVAANGYTLALAWLFVAVPLIAATRIFWPHMLFSLVFLAPFGAALFVVWVFVVGAPPNAPLGSDVTGAQAYVLEITFRLALITAIFQLCFLTILPAHLPATLSRWGIYGDALIIALGALALIPELNRRADQVLTARFARGYVATRSIWVRLVQVPFLLRPLFTWALRSAIQRSETWRQRDMLRRLSQLAEVEPQGSTAGSLLWISISILWLAVAIASSRPDWF